MYSLLVLAADFDLSATVFGFAVAGVFGFVGVFDFTFTSLTGFEARTFLDAAFALLVFALVVFFAAMGYSSYFKK